MKYLFGLLCLLHCYPSYLQTTFNKRFHFGYNSAHLAGIISTDSAYYGMGMVIDTFGTFHEANLFVKFDLEGTPLSTKILYSSSKRYYTYEPAFVSTNDHQFAALAMGVEGIRRFTLIKYDKYGDTIFVKEFEHPQYPNEDFLYPHSLVNTPSNGFLLAGGMENQDPLTNSDVLLIKTDSLGNLEWNQVIGTPLMESGSKVLNDINGNGFVIGGVRTDLNQVNEDYIFSTLLFGVDSMGVKTWEMLTPSGELMDWARDMMLLEDGSMVISSGEGTEFEPPAQNQVWFDKCVFKVSPTGEMLWETLFKEQELSGSAFMTNIERVSDGSGYVIAGTHLEELPDQNSFVIWGWVGKVSNEGDSLWARKYGYAVAERQHSIFDLKEASDGGFIACGRVQDWSNNDSIPQQAWLLKLDQHGCLVPGCHLPNPVQEPGKHEISLAIYPNPTTDYLNFQLRSPQPAKKATFRIVDDQGRLMKEMNVPNTDATFILPVWEWPAGAYFLQYLESGQTLITETFIKQ